MSNKAAIIIAIGLVTAAIIYTAAPIIRCNVMWVGSEVDIEVCYRRSAMNR